MSKAQENRVVVDFADEPILAELELPELLKERQKYAEKELLYKAKRESITGSLFAIVETVKADAVTYTDSVGTWTVSMIRPEPGQRLDEDFLRDNLMKLGKLDAALIQKIIAKSSVPTAPREPYVRITAPKSRNGK